MGVGDKFSLGEYFMSQNMSRTLTGFGLRWNISSKANSNTTSGLGKQLWFTQIGRLTGTNTDVFSLNDNNYIWKSELGLFTWALAYRPAVSGAGQGLLGDQKNRLLYATYRYLGMYDGGDNYTTGSVSVTNGSNAVVGSGTSWTADMVNKRIIISSQATTWYRVAAVADTTHLTLTANFTGATASGLTHAIYVGWHDGDANTTNGSTTWNAKDFGADISPTDTPTQLEIFEDVVLILRKNKVCRLNSDDSFNAEASPAFEMPDKFIGRSISANKNGILMGFNFNSRGVLVLWDNYSTRSIAPWIWLNATVQAIIPYGSNWIVITSREVLLTNGYSTENIAYPLDNIFNNTDFNVLPQGAIIIKDWLIISNGQGRLSRGRTGIQVLNLKTKMWEYSPFLKEQYGTEAGAIFNDSALSTHLSFRAATTSYTHIASLTAGGQLPAIYVTPPMGEGTNQKSAQGVKVEMGIDTTNATASNAFTFTIEVRLCNMKRPLFGYAQAKVLQTVSTELTVNGSTFPYAQVGDEVMIGQGVNVGEVRTITAITGKGTSTEVWTLDSALASMTEQNVFLVLSPFQKVGTKTLTNPTELNDILFPVKNSIAGSKYLVKVIISNVSGNSNPEIRSVSLIYDDLGTL